MIVREPWWIFPELIDADTCARIVALGRSLPAEQGAVRVGNDGSQRKTTIAWIGDDWVYDRVMPWLNNANRAAGWNFQLERILPLQFGVYDEGGHYDWHVDDRGGRVYSAADKVFSEFHGMLRKVSFSLMLNAGDEYDGGDLEIEIGHPGRPERVEVANPKRLRGTMLVFPSFLPHRVTPVTRGVRYSLVGWYCGPPWR